MNAEPRVQASYESPGALAEALYFDSGEHRIFGWLHRSDPEPAASLGLVLCSPFGYEAMCSHRSVRVLAEAAAAAGVPSLRFDYSGTGDSADLNADADQADIWSRDIIAAAAELRRRTGVDRVCLLGIRLGALLATLAAERCKSIDGLILVGPVVDGSKYLRELTVARSFATQRDEPASFRPAVSGPIAVAGFDISAATAAALGQVKLKSLKIAPAPAMLILDGKSSAAAGNWARILEGLGVQMKYLSLPGVLEMTATAPQFAFVPEDMVAAVADWLLQLRGAQPPPAALPAAFSASSASRNNFLTLTGGDGAHRAEITERPVFLASSATVFGILTEPRQGEVRRRAVVLLNAAADHHIGAARLYVSLARKWAARGYFVLRLDFAGIGDSATPLGRGADDVFPPTALDDIRAAIDYLRDRHRISEFTLMGLCSGAYHALHAAASGLPVNRILLVNPLNFSWKKGAVHRDLELAEAVRLPTLYRKRWFSLEHWKRLLRGQGPVGIRQVASIYAVRMRLAVESALRDLARAASIPIRGDLGRELNALADRGVSVVFIFARGEPGLTLLKLQAGSALEHIEERCRIHVIDRADHIFAQSAARLNLEKVLSEELFAAQLRRC